MSRVLRATSAATMILLLAALFTCVAAAGSPRSFAFFQTQGPRAEPIRWNPCVPIRYRINSNGLAGPAAVQRVRAAVAEASAATGIRIVYVGGTRFVPDQRNAPVPRRAGADVVITWAQAGSGPRRSSLLPRKHRLAGVGGYAASRSGPGLRVARTGFVVFDAGHIFEMSPRKQYVAALHELGHLLGLDHVSDRGQVMFSQVLGSGPRHYASGDLQGLRRVGRRAGCLAPAPPPRRPQIVQAGNQIMIAAAPVRSLSGPVTYELSAPELGGRVARSASPRFSLPLRELARTGHAGHGIHFRVVASNRVGSGVSLPTTYEVPAAVVTLDPTLLVSPSRLDLVAPRARLAGTTIDVSDQLRVHVDGSVVAYRVQGGTVGPEMLYEHMIFVGTRVTRWEVTGTVIVRGPGLSKTFDLGGSYLTSATPAPVEQAPDGGEPAT